MANKPASKSAAPAEPSFEEALAELESIVASMESGDLPLEESLQRYQRGIALLRQCQGKLDAADQRIRVLEDGSLQNFDGESGS